MIIVRKTEDLKKVLKKRRGEKIGFIPTMGDLHEGHLSLIRRSKKENDLTVLSIFVNPAQFDRNDDYEKYRRNEKSDLKKAGTEKVDLVFIPTAEEIYPKDFRSWVTVEGLSENLCGKFRADHFRGVATVVLKLFNLIQPANSYFGMKDFQQYKIIERMVLDLNLPVKIIPCPIIREKNGLALSSRNSCLSTAEKHRAAKIYSALQSVAHLIKSGRKVSKTLLLKIFKKQLHPEKSDRIEYLEFLEPDSLLPAKKFHPPLLIAAAVWIGGTRLIDNILMKEDSSCLF